MSQGELSAFNGASGQPITTFEGVEVYSIRSIIYFCNMENISFTNVSTWNSGTCGSRRKNHRIGQRKVQKFEFQMEKKSAVFVEKWMKHEQFSFLYDIAINMNLKKILLNQYSILLWLPQRSSIIIMQSHNSS